jgi:hypothetical protein
MNVNEKITAFIVALNKLTSQEKIIWHIKDPPELMVSGTDNHIPFFVVTEYQGQKYALYQCRSFVPEEPELPHFGGFWTERLILAIIDNKGHVLWQEKSRQSALSDLLETIQRKISNIDNVIDAILSHGDKAPSLQH